MPLVTIDCTECGLIETIESVKWAGDNKTGYPCKCPECGNEATRIIEQGVIQAEGHVRYSRALGFHPDQVADGTAAKIHPGANFVKTEGGMYALEILNRGDKLRRMKERSRYTGKELNEAD